MVIQTFMGSTPNLTLCTFNCRGHRQDKIDYVKKIMTSCDVLFLQEHWLFTENVPFFVEKIGNVNVHATSGMDETQLLIGRPYGGCAILWKKSLNCVFSPIDTGNKRIVAGALSFHNVKILLCNIYMPCDGSYHDPLSQSFGDVLSVVRSLIEMNSADFVLLGGDMNTDLNRSYSEPQGSGGTQKREIN